MDTATTTTDRQAEALAAIESALPVIFEVDAHGDGFLIRKTRDRGMIEETRGATIAKVRRAVNKIDGLRRVTISQISGGFWLRLIHEEPAEELADPADLLQDWTEGFELNTERGHFAGAERFPEGTPVSVRSYGQDPKYHEIRLPDGFYFTGELGADFRPAAYTVEVEKLEDGTWAFFAEGSGLSVEEANREAVRNLPLGYGGHNRAQRALDAITAGETVEAPLGTYRIKREDEEDTAADEAPDHDTRGQEPGLDDDAGRLPDGRQDTRKGPGDVELLTGWTAFNAHVAHVGSAVVVSFKPRRIENAGEVETITPPPVFGRVTFCSGEYVTVEDVETGPQHFAAGTVKTVAIIWGR